MSIQEIWHEVPIQGSLSDLYDGVTDAKKLARWWTTDTRGESEVGKRLEFWFGGSQPAAIMEVTTLKPQELVQWRVVGGGAKEWIGTEVEFKIFRNQANTFLHFRHSKWPDGAKMFPKCSMDWAVFLLSLKELVEKGKGHPYPYDMLPHL